MKAPKTPPSMEKLWQEVESGGRIGMLFAAAAGPCVDGKYLHWDKLIRHTPPAGISHPEWWFSLKFHRQTGRQRVPLLDNTGEAFSYLTTEPIPERLHHVDLGAGGHIGMPEQITNAETKDRYYVSSLIAEAITSSQLEGAATTRLVAKEMIRTGRKPRDKSEQMILNNYKTMQRIGKLKDQPLSEELVLEIHRIVTDRTLPDPTAAGRFRRADEDVVVEDTYGEVFHDPPPASQLGQRIAAMCDFANGKTPDAFVHPAIRSIILHFWLAYEHPFVDGNGRTARALFYWSMLHQRYWLFEFISISQIILKAPAKYGRAFLHTETDDNDLTYFILYHLDVVRRAINELHAYITRKTEQLRAAEAELRGIAALNHRQKALISHALRHPRQRYTIKSHRLSHNVVYQTARTDLLDLHRRGLLDAEKIRRAWYFTPSRDLERRLAETS